ncbi:MAG: hypothetical protein WBI17_07380 [Clostridiaceae bacterium]
MNNFMMIAIVPLGYADKVINAANEAGATGATTLRARGAHNSANEGLFSFKIEPEEEIILIIATKEVASLVSAKIHEEFDHNCARSGSVYILPILD